MLVGIQLAELAADGVRVDPEDTVVHPCSRPLERKTARAHQHRCGLSPFGGDQLAAASHVAKTLFGADVACRRFTHMAPIERVVAPRHEAGSRRMNVC